MKPIYRRLQRAVARFRRKQKNPLAVNIPKRLSDRQLLQDDSQQTIQSFVARQGHGKTFFLKLQRLAEAIGRFPRHLAGFEAARQHWANRPAADILREKRLWILPDKEAAYQVGGCMDACIAYMASVKELSQQEGEWVSVRMVRKGAHSWVRVQWRDQDVLIDPLNGIIRDMHNPEVANAYFEDLQMGRAGEGKGPRDLWLDSLADFNRYWKRKNK